MLLHAAHITIYANKNSKYTPSAQAFINSFCSSVFKKNQTRYSHILLSQAQQFARSFFLQCGVVLEELGPVCFFIFLKHIRAAVLKHLSVEWGFRVESELKAMFLQYNPCCNYTTNDIGMSR